MPSEDSGEFGEIEPNLLLNAYAAGIFPMPVEDGRLGWFCPDPRGILPLDGLRISRSLRATLRKNRFTVTVDKAFREVVEGCAERSSTWIDGRIFRSYTGLHEAGFAHSVEAWQDGKLAGGLYGVALCGLFAGESMFSRLTDASKVCLVHLVERLRAGGFTLHDTQWLTPHLQSLGGIAVRKSYYLARLGEALDVPSDWNALEKTGSVTCSE